MSVTKLNNEIVDDVSRHLGVQLSMDDAQTLRRAALTLQRWSELRCGIEATDNKLATISIEQDDNTGQWFRYWRGHLAGKYTTLKQREPNRYTGAEKRIRATLKPHGLYFYVQSDPRGAPLYVSDKPIDDSNYSSALAITTR